MASRSVTTFSRSAFVRRSAEISPTCGVYRLIQICDTAVVGRPEFRELLEVAVAAHLLSRDRAVHADVVSLDVLEDALVGGGFAPLVVLGLQAVDRDDELKPAEARPLDGNRPHGARDELRVDAHLGHARKNFVELAKANERLAADDRDVQRLVFVEERKHRVDQLLAFEVLQLAQLDLSAQMVVAVCIAAGARQRTLPRNFNREVRLIARENPAPRPDDAFHAAPCRLDRRIGGFTTVPERSTKVSLGTNVIIL